MPNSKDPLHTLRQKITTLRSTGESWRKIADRFPDLAAASKAPHMLIYTIANGDEPADAHIRLALGLPLTKPVPICTECGEAHIIDLSAGCPDRLRSERNARKLASWRTLDDLPRELLRQALEQRTVFDEQAAANLPKRPQT